MADLLLNGDGALRLADAVLRATGGRAVLLRMTAPASSNGGEELGLETPLFQDAELAPATFRKGGSDTKLIVSGNALTAMVTSLEMNSVEAMLEAAAGVVIDGVLYTIEQSESTQGFGVPVCWTLTLRRPAM